MCLFFMVDYEKPILERPFGKYREEFFGKGRDLMESAREIWDDLSYGRIGDFTIPELERMIVGLGV